MRLRRTLAIAASTLAFATGAAFAGGDERSEAALSDQSDPLGYQPYEVYDVYVVPVEEIVLIPLEPSSEPSISGNELG